MEEHEIPTTPASVETLSQFGPVEQTALLDQGSALSPAPAEGAVSFCSPKVPHPASVAQGLKARSPSAHHSSQVSPKWKALCSRLRLPSPSERPGGSLLSCSSSELLHSCLEQRPPGKFLHCSGSDKALCHQVQGHFHIQGHVGSWQFPHSFQNEEASDPLINQSNRQIRAFSNPQ